jgi:hypothetical protein
MCVGERKTNGRDNKRRKPRTTLHPISRKFAALLRQNFHQLEEKFETQLSARDFLVVVDGHTDAAAEWKHCDFVRCWTLLEFRENLVLIALKFLLPPEFTRVWFTEVFSWTVCISLPPKSVRRSVIKSVFPLPAHPEHSFTMFSVAFPRWRWWENPPTFMCEIRLRVAKFRSWESKWFYKLHEKLEVCAGERERETIT